ncbi:WD repeat-containing protein 33 [Rhizophlyctis rosea]|nr:WD repeat-containing protein 33 [Rhizophlyctis rosea]
MLHDFKMLLTAAEDSQRQGDRKEIYEARKHLAGYFQELNRSETAADYYREVLDIASKIPEEPSYEVEAARNLGTVLEQLDNADEALGFYERSRSLAQQIGNKDAQILASKAIVSVRMTIAEELERTNHLPEAISHYQQCVEIIESSSADPHLLNAVHYRLGKANQQMGHVEEAIKYLDTFLQKTREFGDQTKEGWAQAALAACYESMGNLSQAAECLQAFGDLTKSDASQKAAHAQACNQLGMLYNRMGQFDQAVQCFERHYQLTCEMAKSSDTEDEEGASATGESHQPPSTATGLSRPRGGSSSLGTAQVQLGVARGHALMGRFLNLVKDEKNLLALLKWKATGILEDGEQEAMGKSDSRAE